MYVCMYVCMYVYICFTRSRWLSTDVFHSWSLQYAFDPATTSSVVYGVYGGTEWGLEIRLCVSVRKVTSRSRSKIRITFESRSKIQTTIWEHHYYCRHPMMHKLKKNARLAKVIENIFEPRTDWPGDSPRIRRGVLNKMLQPTRPFTTWQKEIL